MPPVEDHPAKAMAKPWEGEGGSFGSWLRQQREIRNITLREISDNTPRNAIVRNLSPLFIAALRSSCILFFTN